PARSTAAATPAFAVVAADKHQVLAAVDTHRDALAEVPATASPSPRRTCHRSDRPGDYRGRNGYKAQFLLSGSIFRGNVSPIGFPKVRLSAASNSISYRATAGRHQPFSRIPAMAIILLLTLPNILMNLGGCTQPVSTMQGAAYKVCLGG